MKNLDFFVTECKAMLDYCSIPYNLDVSVKISRRLRRAYGNCHRKNGVYTIYINDLMLRDDVTDKALENTILHELIHTCPECMNHGRQWKHYCEIVNRELDFNIQRLDGDKDSVITTLLDEKRKQTEPYRYKVFCPECGTTWYYRRKTRCVTHAHNYLCGKCKTHLVAVELTDSEKAVANC